MVQEHCMSLVKFYGLVHYDGRSITKNRKNYQNIAFSGGLKRESKYSLVFGLQYLPKPFHGKIYHNKNRYGTVSKFKNRGQGAPQWSVHHLEPPNDVIWWKKIWKEMTKLPEQETYCTGTRQKK
jgi:hypothetical protein